MNPAAMRNPMRATLCLLLLAGCVPPMEAAICPQEDCLALFVQGIDRAEGSVDCAFYAFDHPEIAESLRNAATRGVKVRIVLHEGAAPGFQSRTAKVPGLMHHKFCVLDGERVVTGSANPTGRDVGYDNNVLALESGRIAGQYGQEFEELWSDDFPGRRALDAMLPFRQHVLFCPEDRCAEALRNEVGGATKSVDMLAFTFTEASLGTELILAAARGVNVRVVLDRRVHPASQRQRLLDNGIEVRLARSELMHHKVLVIDNRTVLTGSFNPTASADSRNAENLLIIRNGDIAAEYASAFRSLWG